MKPPRDLVGLQVTLRYESHDRIEVFVDEQSKGFLKPLNQEVNSRVKRENVSHSGGGKLFERAGGGF